MGLFLGGSLLVLGILLIVSVFIVGKSEKASGRGPAEPRLHLPDPRRQGTARVVPELDRYIKQGDFTIVNQVVDNLESYPPENQEEIRRLLRKAGLVEKYKDNLTNIDSKVRAVTVERLGKLGGDGVPELLFRAMADNNEEVRLAATAALKKTGDPAIAGWLVAALKEPNRWLPARVAEVIISLGEEAVPALHAAVDDTDPVFMGYIIEILGEIGDRSSLDLLHRALRNYTGNIRLQAAGALGKIGHCSSVPLLVETLKDPEVKIKVQAIRSLGMIGGEEVAQKLAEMLKDDNPAIRYSALEALRRMGREGARYIEITAVQKGHPAAAGSMTVIKEQDAGARVNIFYEPD